MASPLDFSDTELWLIRSTLKERYGAETPVEIADVELRVSPGARELTSCPAAYWEGHGAHFVIVKAGEERYRCQFYYRGYEMFGTGIDEYNDLGDCVISVLQVQADHQQKSGAEAPRNESS